MKRTTVLPVCVCTALLSVGICMWWVLHTDDAKKNRPAPSALPVKSVLRQRHEVGSTTYRARTVSTASHSDSRPAAAIHPSVRKELAASPSAGASVSDCARMASAKNQVMDGLLGQPDIPADYGRRMVALFRDKTQDVLTRDFAVQHIGLYAQALHRRGTYRPGSAEARLLRAALDDAADDTGTILAAAAFRALADMTVFDPRIDARRLDSRLVSCLGAASSALAARVMAAQLCGERRIAAARRPLSDIVADVTAATPLRRAARAALASLSPEK